MTTTLNEAEQRLCHHIAKKRYNINREGGVEDKKKGDQSNYFTDLNGFGGELAFCKMLNLYPDTEVKITSQKTDQGDCIINGMRVDVKTTKYSSGKLIAAKWKADNVDAYALITGEFPTYTFRGYATREALFQKENLQDLGKGELYALTQKQLTKKI